LIRDLGADEIVRDGKSLAAAGGADVILSTSNSTKSMVDSIQGLRPDGRLITMGADAEPLTISLMDLISTRIRVIGSQQNGPEYLYEALDFVAQGKVKTIVETYPLADAPKAYQRVVEGKALFRAVLTMESSIRAVTARVGRITGYFPRNQIREELRLSGSWPIRPAPLRFSLLIHLDVESAQMTLSRGELWVHRRRANNRSVPVSLSESRKLVSRDLPRLIGSPGSSPGIAFLSGPGVLVL